MRQIELVIVFTRHFCAVSFQILMILSTDRQLTTHRAPNVRVWVITHAGRENFVDDNLKRSKSYWEESWEVLFPKSLPA